MNYKVARNEISLLEYVKFVTTQVQSLSAVNTVKVGYFC